jgi:hypothetical protein
MIACLRHAQSSLQAFIQGAVFLINSLRKYKKQLKPEWYMAMVVASLALVWSSVNAPERARNALSVAMERKLERLLFGRT